MTAPGSGHAGLGVTPAPTLGQELAAVPLGGDAGLTGPQPERGVGDEALEEALVRAYRFLASRDRTVAELRRHMTRQGIADGLIDATVAELSTLGYLDDARFAARFSEDRRSLDGWGNERIRLRLRALGVSEALCDQACARGADDEIDAAVALLRRRVRRAPTDARDRQRALGLLVRRGFELELAHDAVRRFEAEAA